MTNFQLLEASLPASVAKLICAAGGDNPAIGGVPYAIASMMGAIPWIAVALSKGIPAADYQNFLRQLRVNMDLVWEIASADNPQETFAEIRAQFEALDDAFRAKAN